MPRFAANITTMFLELPMPERIQAALTCGFKATEFLLPYGWSVEEIRSWPGADEIEFILMNTQLLEKQAQHKFLDSTLRKSISLKTMKKN